MESTFNSSTPCAAPDWSLARSDMRVRVALVAEIDAGRFSCEAAALAAGVGSNVVRTWRHRQRKASAIPAGKSKTQFSVPTVIGGTATNKTTCEEIEKAELEGLAANLARKAKLATDGKEAKAFVDAMSTALDLRRRAHGLPMSREKGKSASPKSSPLVFVSAVPIRTPQIRDAGDSEVVHSHQSKLCHDMPPALAAIMAEQNLPAWQRAL